MASLEVILNLVDNLSPAIDSARASVDNLSSTIDNTSNSIDSVKADSIENVGNASTVASENVNNIQDAADNAASSVESIDSSALDNVSNTADGAANSIETMEDASNATEDALSQIDDTPIKNTSISADDAAAAGEDMAGSLGLVETALAGIASVGIETILSQGLDLAGGMEDRWSRIDLTFGNVSTSAEKMQQRYGGAIIQMMNDTGRSKGVILNTMAGLGRAGITNSTVLVSSFDTISAAAMRTGNPIEGVALNFERAVRKGQLSDRVMQSLGLTMDGVGGMMEKTGKSAEQITTDFKNMTPEARSLFLTQMMGTDNVTKANEEYKKSWEHAKESVDRAYDSLKRIVGEIIMPILIPIMDKLTHILTDLGNGLQSLDSPTKTIVGYILLFVAGLISLGAIIGVINGLMTILGIRTGLAAIAHGVYTAALGIATAAQWAFNIAVDANPIGLIILAIIAIIAIIIYFWETNEGFRNAVMNAWESIKGVVMPVIDAIIGGIGWLWDTLQGIWNNIVAWATGISQSASDAGSGFINNIITFFTQLPGRIWNLLLFVLTFIGNFINQLLERARLAGSNFVNNIISFIRNLPQNVWNWLLNTINKVANFAHEAGAKAREAGQKIINNIQEYLISLPGKMYEWGRNAIKRFVDSIIDAIPGLRWALDQVARLFPHSPPKEGPLSKVKPERSYEYGASLTRALNEGLESEELFNFIPPNKQYPIITGKSGGGLVLGQKELKLYIVHDFKNVPSQLSKEELLLVFKSMTNNSELIDAMVKLLSHAKLGIKTNLGI